MELGFILAMFIIGYFLKDLFKIVGMIFLFALFYVYGVEALEVIFNTIVRIVTYFRGVFV